MATSIKSSLLNFPFSSCMLLILLILLSSTSHTRTSHAFEYIETTIDDIQSAFAQNEITSKDLLNFYKDQISALNSSLAAIIELNPDAESQAEIADQNRMEGKNGTKLSGIPVLLKDNLATKDQLNTTTGSFALLGSIVPRDSFVAKRLRDAGAIIMGKASLTEWSGYRSSGTAMNGWCARGGQGRNPYNLEGGVCKSSTGSAIAAAANLVTVTLGHETSGSIICPSTTHSIVGIKPTVALTSRSGSIPVSLRQDSIGPMTRTVADAVHVLDIIAGADENDPDSIEASTHIPTGGYAKHLISSGLKGKRLGILRAIETDIDSFVYPEDSIVNKTFEQHLQTMRDQGATLIDNLVINIDGILEPVQIATAAEFKRDLNAYLAELEYSPVQTLEDIINFNNAHKELEKIDEYGQDLLTGAQETNGINETVQIAIATLDVITKNRYLKLMEDYELDAVVYPANFTTPFLAIGGFPIITVPAGYDHDNMPFGIGFGGLKFSEPTLIEIAYGYEQATKVRKPPPVNTLRMVGNKKKNFIAQI